MSDGQGRRRVVITGIGAVTPCGLDAEQTWRSVREGRSGVSAVEGFEGHVRIAAQVKGFEPERYMEHRSVRKTDRFAQFAVAAATMAVEDAGIDIGADAERIGCSIGTGLGGLKTEEIGRTSTPALRAADPIGNDDRTHTDGAFVMLLGPE